jgi:hypothetical protein
MQPDTLEKTNGTESFRDQVATVSSEGKRLWVYHKKPKGKFYNARTIVSYLLLTILFVTPFIKVKNHPFFLFNIIDRKFILYNIFRT